MNTPQIFRNVCFLLLAACGQESASTVTQAEPAEADCCAEDALPGAVSSESLPGESLFHLHTHYTDTGKRQRSLSSFAGRPTVVAMIFTHCEYACPVILQDLLRLEEGLTASERDQVQWLLISFDSERDTPEVLAKYAAENRLDETRWTLLHAEEDVVRETAAVLGVRYKQTPTGGFSHSNRITILDRQGGIAQQLDGLKVDVTPGVEALRRLLAAQS